MTFEAIATVCLILAMGIVAGAAFFRRTRFGPAGVVRANPFTDQKIRNAALAAIKATPIGKLPREEAQALLEEVARHAVAREYASIYRGQKFEVSATWPGATCIITGNIAVVELWVGHEIMGGDGIMPLTVEIDRSEVKLSAKPPIKDALAAMHAPPPKEPARPVHISTGQPLPPRKRSEPARPARAIPRAK